MNQISQSTNHLIIQSINLWFKIGLLIGAFVFCYVKLFENLVRIWFENSIYSHGFLIPFLSIYLVWLQRNKLGHIQSSPNKILGLLILMSGLFMLIVGHVGGILFIQEFSLILTITGVVILLLGKDSLKVLWLPIGYLSLMLTVWGTFIEPLHGPFQNLSAFIGSELLKITGIPVYRDSIYISLPNITLEVAKECSGMGYLIAVFAIAIPISFIFLKSWWRRIILIFGSVIIAILGNSLRIGAIGFFSYYNLSKGIHGPNQVFQAMFVSWFGIIALLIGTWILSKGQSSSFRKTDHKNSFYKLLKIFLQNNSKNYLFLTIGILFISGSFINFYDPLPVSLKNNLSMFPYNIKGWRGVDCRPEPFDEIFKELGVDHELRRSYKNHIGTEIKLYIGYYEYQKQDKELINYKFEELLKGASNLEFILNPETIKVNKVIKIEGEITKVIVFWYDIDGHIVSDRLKAKMYTIFEGLFKRRTNGAIIMLSADLKDKDLDSFEFNNDLTDFIKKLIPVLYKYLPS